MTGLSVRGLTLAWPGAREAAPVVEDVSFSAPRGAVTAILGGRASGKTLLLAGIAGLVKAQRGAVLVEGADVSRRRARGVGLLAPGSVLRGGRGVTQAVRVLANAKADAAEAALLALGIEAAASRKVDALSHSEGFCVLATARLLVAGGVLLVDEAGEGLDAAAREGLAGLLGAAATQGRTVVVATRDASVAMRADHLVLLHEGRVVQAGAPRALYEEPRDEAAARLTGPANIVRGTVRQKIPGGFVWAAGGCQFRQDAGVGAPVPVLAGEVTLCLRPGLLRAVQEAGAEMNRIGGIVERVLFAGGYDEVRVDTVLGVLAVHLAPGSVRAGQTLELAWRACAATVLAAPFA